MNEMSMNPAPATSSGTRPARRRSPKSIEQRFADKQEELEKLRLQIQERREGLRSELVDDLYKVHDIKPTGGDPTETKRLDRLRKQLGMAS